MKRLIGVAAGIAMVAACADPAPTSTERDGPSLSHARPTVFNTQLRSELEVPTSTPESKGLAQLKIFEDGTIESMVIINNKGGESVRFGHIHRLSPGFPTGPSSGGFRPPSVPISIFASRRFSSRVQRILFRHMKRRLPSFLPTPPTST
jgi:hypothetical protein